MTVIVIAAVAACIVALAQSASTPLLPLLKDFRIAMRLDNGQILIIGGQIDNVADTVDVPFPEERYGSTRHGARSQPDSLYFVTPQHFGLFHPQPATALNVGDTWTIYAGVGAPAVAHIKRQTVNVVCGGPDGYASAVAEFDKVEVTDLMGGMRVREYLAAPGPPRASVFSFPVILDESRLMLPLAKMLQEYAVQLVKDENWTIAANATDETSVRTRARNRALLTQQSMEPRLRFSRWSPAGRKPLLFVEALWISQDRLPVFAANAVVEEDDTPKILWIDSSPGKLMRAGEMQNAEWKLEDPGPFLNAWKIGDQYFILVKSRGYEGFSVDLMELVSGQGLVPTGLGYGAGC
jgi:hypothetical protein